MIINKSIFFLGSYPCDFDNIGEPWCPEPIDYDRPPIADFYSISYMYLGTLGLLTTVIIGIISYMVFCVNHHSPSDLPIGVLFPAIDKRFKRKNDSKNKELVTTL